MTFTGVVLAGGRGERMGADKVLLDVRGTPLFRHAVDALAPHCAEILVMGGPRAARLAPVAGGARVFADPGEGPPRALVLAARLARHDRLLVLAGDMPRITSSALAPLIEAAAGKDADVVIAIDGVGQPLVGAYRRSTLLAFRGRSLRDIPSLLVNVSGAASMRDADVTEDL